MSDLNKLSAIEAAARLGRGDITAEALVRACLERIDTREAHVGAWSALDRGDRAMAAATACDRGGGAGALAGLPFGVKDIFDTFDLPTSYGSRLYAGHQPPWDASVVARGRALGGVVLGKTVTTEFAYFFPGKTQNPRRPGHTPGGSSSGSAAAVADFMVPWALGTQTAGSIIRPASYCGVAGYKPTRGTIDRTGVKTLAATLDTVGVLARTVADAAFVTAALADWPSLYDPEPAARAPRLGLVDLDWSKAETSTQALLEEAHRRLGKRGAVIKQLVLSSPLGGLGQAHASIMAYDAARALASESHRHGDSLSEPLRALLSAGKQVSRAQYTDAHALATRCRGLLDSVFRDVDVLLAPSAPGEAPGGLGSTGDPIFNRTWTLLGLPCVNIPGLVGPTGLPLGIQVIGPFGEDPQTLASARWVEGQLG